jgi:hypothetical protein
MGENRGRFPTADTLLAETGTGPVTWASGRSVRFRYAANQRIRHAIDWWTFKHLPIRVRAGFPRVGDRPCLLLLLTLSGWPDSNRRPLRPERSALPSCATPRGVPGNSSRRSGESKSRCPTPLEQAPHTAMQQSRAGAPERTSAIVRIAGSRISFVCLAIVPI